MKKRKKIKVGRFKSAVYPQSSKSQVIEIAPEKVVISIRRAEERVVPIIKEHQLPPAAAFMLLAQYTHVLVTGKPQISVKSTMAITPQILELWKIGYYAPGPEYPYTLEETLEDKSLEVEQDYAASFQPFLPSQENISRGIGKVYGGLVKHPQSHLWQIWVMIERQCIQLGAYRDSTRAQKGLEALISLSRKGGSTVDIYAAYDSLVSQADEVPQQIPFNMMQYLVDHIDLYKIDL